MQPYVIRDGLRKGLITDDLKPAFCSIGESLEPNNCRSPAHIVETPQNPNRALRRMNTGGLGRNRKTRAQSHQSWLFVASKFLGYTLGYTKLTSGKPEIAASHRRPSGRRTALSHLR